MAFLWMLDAGGLFLEVEQWAPLEGLAAKDVASSGHLVDWAEEGELRTTPGKVVDYVRVVRRMVEKTDGFGVYACMDPYQAGRLRDAAHLAGLPVDREEKMPSWPDFEVLEHPQGSAPHRETGLHMERSIDVMANTITERAVRILSSPVLNWNLGNADIVKDTKGNRKWAKHRAGPTTSAEPSKIDGLVAASMAFGLADIVLADGLAGGPFYLTTMEPGSWY